MYKSYPLVTLLTCHLIDSQKLILNPATDNNDLDVLRDIPGFVMDTRRTLVCLNSTFQLRGASLNTNMEKNNLRETSCLLSATFEFFNFIILQDSIKYMSSILLNICFLQMDTLSF